MEGCFGANAQLVIINTRLSYIDCKSRFPGLDEAELCKQVVITRCRYRANESSKRILDSELDSVVDLHSACWVALLMEGRPCMLSPEIGDKVHSEIDRQLGALECRGGSAKTKGEVRALQKINFLFLFFALLAVHYIYLCKSHVAEYAQVVNPPPINVGDFCVYSVLNSVFVMGMIPFLWMLITSGARRFYYGAQVSARWNRCDRENMNSFSCWFVPVLMYLIVRATPLVLDEIRLPETDPYAEPEIHYYK